MKQLVFLLSLLITGTLTAQKATVSGKVLNEEGLPLTGVSISLHEASSIQITDADGKFQISVPAQKAIALIFTHTGYAPRQKNFYLQTDEQEFVTIVLKSSSDTLESVLIRNEAFRQESGLVVFNPKYSLHLPSPVSSIESLIKIFVGSNNELSSQYTVRGGNYDENLVYVNDFEIYRPYLIRSGQQEGLSFINPEMARDVKFYNGGFSARYGDKMSSVLDITYKTPQQFGGSVYMSLLEQGVHLEGITKNKKFTYNIGARNRSNQNLLKSQETTGNYVPSSSDLQAYLTYQINKRQQLDLLTNLSGTRFFLRPAFSQLTSSVFTPYMTSNLGLDIFFEGKEQDRYQTNMIGLSWKQQIHEALQLKWLVSFFENKEEESYDLQGRYLFGERTFDRNNAGFGNIEQPLGSGIFHQFARNFLTIQVNTIAHKGNYKKDNHVIDWGLQFDQQRINDRLLEWEYQDSAGYHLPYDPDQIGFSRAINTSAALRINRGSVYVTDNWAVGKEQNFIVQAGARLQYNDLNEEWLLSPRIGFSYHPIRQQKDIIWKMSAGIYQQPPFYREMRRPDGSINTALKAQKSWQITGGFDYQFSMRNTPFRLSSELYYKSLWDVVSYDIDNVRIRYSGENDAKAYAAGVEMRLFGELVKDAESWISVGFMRTKENLHNDYYYDYTLDDQNNVIDSSLMEGGWFRRPTDRLFTLGMFVQDYLSTNKNIKVYMNLLYGSNLPFNIPNSIKYRNGLTIDPYMRIDIGFSALLLNNDRSKRRSHHPFRNFENIWCTFEVFNLIDRANTISYLLIKDYNNSIFAMPNRLTPQLINLKLIARF